MQDVNPKLISKVEPEYTDETRRAGASAIIRCCLVVNPDGVPGDIQVVRGAGFGLDENAMRAVSAWRFQPATTHGTPVAAIANVEVSFRLLVGNRDHQLASFEFTLPAGGTRPQLIHGKVPENPKNLSDAKLGVALTVGVDGRGQGNPGSNSHVNWDFAHESFKCGSWIFERCGSRPELAT